MAAISTNVAVNLGLISATVRVLSATDRPEPMKSLCIGTESGHGHAPTPVRMPRLCPECGEVTNYKSLVKGRKHGTGYQIVTSEEVEALTAETTAFAKKTIELTTHPRESVDLSTRVGEKVYYLEPQGPGRYSILVRLVQDNPDLSFCGQFTPRSAISTFELIVIRGVLALRERVPLDTMKEVPVIEKTPVNEALLAVAQSVLPGMVTNFDPENYADQFAKRLNDVLSSRTAVEVLAGPATTPGPVSVSTDDDLLAALSSLATQQKAKSRKPAARKPRTTTKVT